MMTGEIIEHVEVLLSNLLALRSPVDDCFDVAHDDVVVSLQSAIFLLRLAQDDLILEKGSHATARQS